MTSSKYNADVLTGVAAAFIASALGVVMVEYVPNLDVWMFGGAALFVGAFAAFCAIRFESQNNAEKVTDNE